MQLPVMPPVAPMLAKATKTVPRAAGLYYEPKWDGFRCIVFRDGDEIELGSRNERPMTRYFPELVTALADALPERCVVDGEIVVRREGRLEFEVLQQRIHPAKSRVDLLAAQTPASFIAFDLLAEGDESLLVPTGGDVGHRCRLGPPDADHYRSGPGRALVPALRGSRPGRRGRQGRGHALPP
jgi:ATP-dependent DNA ligase